MDLKEMSNGTLSIQRIIMNQNKSKIQINSFFNSNNKSTRENIAYN